VVAFFTVTASTASASPYEGASAVRWNPNGVKACEKASSVVARTGSAPQVAYRQLSRRAFHPGERASACTQAA